MSKIDESFWKLYPCVASEPGIFMDDDTVYVFFTWKGEQVYVSTSTEHLDKLVSE